MNENSKIEHSKVIASVLLIFALLFTLLPHTAQAKALEYDVTANNTKHGFVTILPEHQRVSGEVTITVDPYYGYQVDKVVAMVEGKSDDLLKLTKLTDSVYTFEMPAADVVVKATFEKKKASKPERPDNPAIPDFPHNGNLPYTDVVSSAWYYDAVKYVYNNGIMEGYSNKLFMPNDVVTRGMMAQILYAYENPNIYDTNNHSDFWDVQDTAWYCDAVQWVSHKGIMKGYGNGAFRPNEPLTREQACAVLNRYAEFKHDDTSRTISIKNYRDAKQVSSWAKDSVKWAVASDIMEGKGYHMLAPLNSLNRAEIAQMLMNYSIVANLK